MTLQVPTYSVQSERLLLWFAANFTRPSDAPRVLLEKLTEVAGSFDEQDTHYVLHGLYEQGFIEKVKTWTVDTGPRVKITPLGWIHIEDLQRRGGHSNTAFMAMQYGDSVLDDMFSTCFRPACEAAGFELRRLDEQPKAGVIDNHLRVEIRQSKVLLADLSAGNRGAYWEAGFAEGLGRPVVYLCERSIFDDKETAPHFDTNHCQTILWSVDTKDEVAGELLDTIRNTLPEVATMQSDTESS